MKEVLKNKYQSVCVNAENNIIIFEWLETTESISDVKFMAEIEIAAKEVEKHKMKKILLDCKNFKYLISPEIQIKTDYIIMQSYYKVGLEKLAILLPEDLFYKISIEQTIETNKNFHSFISKYFSNVEEANNWLNEKN